MLVLLGPPSSLGLDSHPRPPDSQLCPSHLFNPFLQELSEDLRVLFIHDAQLIPHQPFFTELSPNALRYTVYWISF